MDAGSNGPRPPDSSPPGDVPAREAVRAHAAATVWLGAGCNSPVPSSYAAGVGLGDPLTLSAASSTAARGSGKPSQASSPTRDHTTSLAQVEWRNRSRRAASRPCARRSVTSPAASSNTSGHRTLQCQFAWCHRVSGCDDADQSPSA